MEINILAFFKLILLDIRIQLVIQKYFLLLGYIFLEACRFLKNVV